MNLRNRFTWLELERICIAGIFTLGLIILFLICWATSGCVCENNSLNFSLINSRSPAINAGESNTIQAATGFTGGGTLEAEMPLTP